MKKMVLILFMVIFITGCSKGQVQENKSLDLPYKLIADNERIELDNGETVSSTLIVESVVSRDITVEENKEFTKQMAIPASNDLGKDNVIVEVIFSDVTLIEKYINTPSDFTPQIWNNNENVYAIADYKRIIDFIVLEKEDAVIGQYFEIFSYQYLVPRSVLTKESQFKLMPDTFFNIEESK